MSGMSVNWSDAQQALGAEVARVTALLRSVQDSTAPALGSWSLGDVAMHLSQGWVAVPGLARDDLSRVYDILPGQAGVAGQSLIGDVWDLGSVTMDGVRADPERDLSVLAGRIEERAEVFFRECEGRSAAEPHAWLVEGTTVELSTLTCHLLNETVMHGTDIARAAGRSWPMDPANARLVLQGFFLPVLARLDPRALVDQAKAAGVRATYDIRIRGGGSVHFLFDDGALTVAEPSDRRVACHILADPVALLNVIWGRQNQWKAIVKGQLRAWGRRPWLGPRLRVMMRNP